MLELASPNSYPRASDRHCRSIKQAGFRSIDLLCHTAKAAKAGSPPIPAAEKIVDTNVPHDVRIKLPKFGCDHRRNNQSNRCETVAEVRDGSRRNACECPTPPPAVANKIGRTSAPPNRCVAVGRA